MDTKVKLKIGEGGLVLSIGQADSKDDDIKLQQPIEQIPKEPTGSL